MRFPLSSFDKGYIAARVHVMTVAGGMCVTATRSTGVAAWQEVLAYEA